MSEFSDKENSRTYAVSGHTVAAPRLVTQKRKVPTSTSSVAESTITVVYGTEDAEGNPLTSKVAIGANVRYPANGQAADVAAAKAVFRDLVASDEFDNLVDSQAYVQ
jgi:hypothetical protein